MGHASITVTAHIYADLYDDELDDVASALDALDDTPGTFRKNPAVWDGQFGRILAGWDGDHGASALEKQALNWAFGSGPDWDRTSDLPRVRRTLSP
jgi:hypothetical protein